MRSVKMVSMAAIVLAGISPPRLAGARESKAHAVARAVVRQVAAEDLGRSDITVVSDAWARTTARGMRTKTSGQTYLFWARTRVEGKPVRELYAARYIFDFHLGHRRWVADPVGRPAAGTAGHVTEIPGKGDHKIRISRPGKQASLALVRILDRHVDLDDQEPGEGPLAFRNFSVGGRRQSLFLLDDVVEFPSMAGDAHVEVEEVR